MAVALVYQPTENGVLYLQARAGVMLLSWVMCCCLQPFGMATAVGRGDRAQIGSRCACQHITLSHPRSRTTVA